MERNRRSTWRIPVAVIALAVPIVMIDAGLAASRAGFDLGLVLFPLVGLGIGICGVMFLFDESDYKTIALILYIPLIIGLAYCYVTTYHARG